MKYEAFLLNLSDAQMSKLSSGESVRIKPEQIGVGDDQVFLTASQIKKLQKHKSQNKGLNFKMSQSQLKHQVKSGNGRFTDFLKKGWNKVKEVAPKIVQAFKPQLENLGKKLIEKGADEARAKLSKANVNPMLQPFLQHGLDLAKQYSQDELKAVLSGISQGSGLYAPGGASMGY